MVNSVSAVIKNQQVAVRQQRWRMLLREHWRPKFPNDLTAFTADDHDGRDVAKTDDDVAVGQLLHCVGVRPLMPPLLDSRDAIRLWVEVFPAAPFPDNVAFGRHL